MGFSLQWLLLVQSMGFRVWELQLLGSRTQALQLWYTGLVASCHVGCAQIRSWTHISCFGRQIFYQWATREAPTFFLDIMLSRLWCSVNIAFICPAGFLSCSVFLFLCQYHTVLTIVALWYSLKSGSQTPPAPFFLSHDCLTHLGVCVCFHTNLKFFF